MDIKKLERNDIVTGCMEEISMITSSWQASSHSKDSDNSVVAFC